MYLIPVLFFNFLLAGSSTSSAECPDLLDGQMLDFANPKGMSMYKSKSGGCPRILACDVVSAPAETIVEWFYNGELVKSNSAGGVFALLGQEKGTKSQLGLSETSHRLCLSELTGANPNEPPSFGKKNGSPLNGVVKCRVRLGCNPAKWIESDPLTVGQMEPAALMARRTARETIGNKRSRQSNWKTPSIYLVTSSRMELAGHMLQIMCRAKGEPKPRIEWSIIAEDGNQLVKQQPIGKYPFIMELNNGDLIIDSSMTEHASFSLRCRAANINGEDSAISTVILLNE